MSKLIENMIQSGELSAAARDMDPYDTLVQWAEANALDTVSIYADGAWDDYAWEAENDGTTRRIVLKGPIPRNDFALYFSTTDTDILAALERFKGSGVFDRDNGLDPYVVNMRPAE